MAGYSGTPLPKKLGIKEQFRVAMFDLPADVKSELKTSLVSCNRTTLGPLDFAMIFVKTAAELKKHFPTLRKTTGACRDALGKLAEESLWRGDRL